MKARLRRWLRLAKALAREPRLPRPVRWLLVVGMLPWPGPVDEGALLLALGLVVVFYRDVLREVRRDVILADLQPPDGYTADDF